MSYAEEFEDPMRRVHSTLETIDAGTAASRGDDVRWCRAWRDTIRRMGPETLWANDKACRKVINSRADETDKAIARRALHLIRDGFRLAGRVDEIDHDLRKIYPADLPKKRLDEELGWQDQDGDSLAMKLDRACMKSRVSNPDTHLVMIKAFAYIRGKFPTLEMGG